MIKRKKTKKIKVGNLYIGGNAPISIQTMVKTDAHDVTGVVKQINQDHKIGCDITRINVLDLESVKNFSKIKKQINIPLVADIHFNYKWALKAIKQGVDKLRINPGNIGGPAQIKKIVTLAKKSHIPIRIGVNAGSLEKNLLNKYKKPCAQALVESASRHIHILEKLNFDQIVVSLKSSEVATMIKANQLFSQKYEYPLHLGVTEAGPIKSGTIKSTIGISTLLMQGIGDTIRVSLSSNSKEEIIVAKEILKILKLRKGPTLISCPTCSRTQYPMLKLVKKTEKYLATINKPIKVAIMGCVVNGPGEAQQADIGIAGGKNKAVLFMKGKIIKTIENNNMYQELKKAINQF